MTHHDDIEILASWQARAVLEGFIEAAVAMLDVLDGDPDLGPDGDELDGTAAEDDFYPHSNWRAEPGCPVSDPGEDDDPAEVDDEPEDDDPAGQCDEDGVNTGGTPRFGWGGPRGAGCPISDPGGDEHDGREPDDGY